MRTWIVGKEEKQIPEQEIIAWCWQYLVNHKVASEIDFNKQLPRTFVGKLLCGELVRHYQSVRDIKKQASQEEACFLQELFIWLNRK